MQYRYDPRAYVPGGATSRVARAIQARGWRRPVVGRRPLPPVAGGVTGRAPLAPAVDPLMTRANNTIFQMTNPLLQRLATARVAAEQNARKAYEGHTAALESGLTATTAPIGQAYGAAQASAAATEEALARRLRGEGEASSQSLAAKLAQINSPANADANTQMWRGAENAGFATGSADLQHLIGRGAEAKAYAGKLPQFARLESNRGLESALSDFRQQFGEQEQGIVDASVQNAFDLWQGFRGEQAQERQAAQQAVQDEKDRAAKERMALVALKANAATAMEKRAFDAQIKALDRDSRERIAQLNADVRIATDNPSKPPARTGAANQKFITVNGQVVKNPNYVPPSQGGSKNDTWQTPGSAKRQRVLSSVRDSIVDPNTGQIRQRFIYSATPDKDISRKIWAVISAQIGDTTSPAAKKLYRDAFKLLEGTPSAKGRYQLPAFVKGK